MFKQNNRRLFEEVYRGSYDSTLKYVVLKCNNIVDAKDIVQDIYLELYKIMQKEDFLNIENHNAYIIGIAKNKLKKFYGLKYKLKNFSFFIEEDIDPMENIMDDVNVEELVLNNIRVEEIWVFLKNKKAVIGKIFYLYYYLDQTIKEISIELDINESTVKNYIYRTLKDLKHTFGKDSD